MNNEEKKLAKNTAALYLMNIVKLIFPLLTLPYLTRVLSTETYGSVTYVKSLIVYIQLFIDFGFLLSATKNIVKANDNNTIGLIVGNTIFVKIILGIISTLIFIVISLFLPIIKTNLMFAFIYLLATLSSIFILDFLYRGIEKMNYVAIPYIISKSISLVLTFLMVKNDKSINFIPIFELLGNVVAAFISLFFLKKVNIKISLKDIKNFKKDLKDSSIYFISNFATTIFGALTTIVAGIYISIENIAFWGVCMQILSAAKALYNPLTNSLYPYMLRRKDLKLIKKISIIMMIPMILGIFIVLFGNQFIFNIIGGIKYEKAGIVLIYLLPAFVFSFYSMLFGWPVLGAIDKNKETTFSTIIAALFQIMGLFILGITNLFSLKSLAICCSITEFMLFIIRIAIVYSNRKMFNSIECKKKEGMKNND